jgi:hypothetical protein
MKMAKASQADLDMGSDLCAAFGSLTDRWCPTLPEAIAEPREGSEIEPFDSHNDEQCGRALRHLLDTVERGSLFRVVMGMAVVLDPRNHCVDPNADTLEHHPMMKAALAAAQQTPACGACPGDGSVCSSTCRLQADSPPSAPDQALTLVRYAVTERMPDADTDVLIWDATSHKSQLGAYMGDDEHGPLWIDAQGAGVAGVTHWAELP